MACKQMYAKESEMHSGCTKKHAEDTMHAGDTKMHAGDTIALYTKIHFRDTIMHA